MASEVKSKQLQKKWQAQGMVEFALVLPVLLLIVLGIFAFAHLFFIYILNVSASREAARYGVAIGETVGGIPRYQDCEGIRSAAKRIGILTGITDNDIIIEYDNGPGTAVFGNCPVGGQGPNIILGNRIIVVVTTTYTPFIPIVNLPSFPIASSAARTIVKDIYVGTAGALSTPTLGGGGGGGGPTGTATVTSTATITPTVTETQIPVFCPGTGSITYQFYDKIAQSEITALYGDSDFPDNPDSSSTLANFDGPVNSGNNYGARIVGWVCPPYSGDYTFYLAVNNEGELWLSTDDTEGNESKIAYIYDGFSDHYEWNKYTSQLSGPITLVAGQLYWIEALQKEGGGTDNLAVAWNGPGFGGSPVLIDGQYLKPGP